jgi:TRAP transporter 4TM/12TM fusion protein
VRNPAGIVGKLIAVTAVVMSLYHIYYRLVPSLNIPIAPGFVIRIGPVDSLVLRDIHLLFSLVLVFFLYPLRKGLGPRIPVYDLIFAALSVVVTGYLLVRYEYVVTRFATVHPLEPADFVMAVLAILLVLEATRRAIGLALPITALVFIAYGFLGPYLPGFLNHRGMSLELILDQTYLTTEGIFGIPLGVSATYVILFVIFGAFLEKSGAGQFFMNFANALMGRSRGGPGKVAVVSSSLFGTISGSAVANVMVDGWLTIPMMKRTGFKPESAAAIEATASTGGQIMPPVMGAAAFVMAEFVGKPYSQIALHAAIPAVLYYVALFAAIHFEAIKTGLRGLSREEVPPLLGVLWRQGHLLVPVLILFVLLVQGYTASYAALVATAAVIVLSWLRRESRITPAKAVEALKEGAINTLPVAMATACAGIIIGIILQTGLALKFTSFLLSAAGGTLIPVLAITMVAGLILGMGMPTTPAYIVQAALLAPAIERLGVDRTAAHMFIFYYSCLSAVSPPVALAVYAAASIGHADLWRAGLQAMKFAAAGFIVPFFFVFNPELLMMGDPAAIIRATVTSTVGSVVLAAGLQGYLLRPANLLERALFIVGALLLIDPALTTDVIGVALVVLGLGLQRLRRAPAPVRAAETEGD